MPPCLALLAMWPMDSRPKSRTTLAVWEGQAQPLGDLLVADKEGYQSKLQPDCLGHAVETHKHSTAHDDKWHVFWLSVGQSQSGNILNSIFEPGKLGNVGLFTLPVFCVMDSIRVQKHSAAPRPFCLALSPPVEWHALLYIAMFFLCIFFSQILSVAILLGQGFESLHENSNFLCFRALGVRPVALTQLVVAASELESPCAWKR